MKRSRFYFVFDDVAVQIEAKHICAKQGSGEKDNDYDAAHEEVEDPLTDCGFEWHLHKHECPDSEVETTVEDVKDKIG